ncbi:MAG: FecR family protein [Pirellulales bacterium]
MSVSPDAFNLPELSRLLLAQLTDGLSSREHLRLESLLESNAAARAVYLDYMHDSAVMRQVLHADQPDEAEVELHDKQSIWTAAYDMLIQPIFLSVLVSGLVITIGVLSLALIAAPDWRADDGGAPPYEFVARIERTSGARWSAASDIVPNRVTDLLAGEPVELLAGLAELHFRDGAVVLLEAPARFTPQTRNSGELLRGQLTAQVPAEAVGFTINTGRVRVVDLGTEFGVAANESGATDVSVVSGEVELYPPDEAATGGAIRVTRITAGQSVRIDAAGLRRVDPAAMPRFTRRLPGRAAVQHQRTGPPAEIRFVGKQLNLTAFRTPSVPKLHDADGDGVYGTAGYYFFNMGSEPQRRNEAFSQRARISLPRFVVAVRPESNTGSAGGFGYLSIDDPQADFTGDVPEIESGVAALPIEYVSLEREQNLFAIVLGDSLPEQGFRIGVLSDNLRSRNMPQAIRLSGAGGDSGPIRVDGDLNQQGDWFFFDVTDALSGDVLTISIDNRGTERASKTLGGLVFDVRPLPTTN